MQSMLRERARPRWFARRPLRALLPMCLALSLIPAALQAQSALRIIGSRPDSIVSVGSTMVQCDGCRGPEVGSGARAAIVWHSHDTAVVG